MGKNVLFYSATSSDDFKKKLGITFVEGGGVPSNNQWTFITAENAARINSASGTSGVLRFKLGYLYVGDVIEIEAEFLNISGVKGKIGIDKVTETGSFISNFTTNSANGDNYEPTKEYYLVTADGYYDAIFGLYTSDAGEFKIRKPTVRVGTVKQHSRGSVVTSTLLNGWTGEVNCKKNELGVTTVSAKIMPTGTLTAGTKITTLPVGYRPPTNGVAQLMDDFGGVAVVLRFQANGDLIIPSSMTFNTTIYYQFFMTFLAD